ncbi:MAG: SDR family oxidoreductase [Planctomycetaceae bacterium]|nr:SDR family oxidoreductase [Planctomycetaceae bacterium]
MRPDWTSDEEGEGTYPHAHSASRSDLPIVEPDPEPAVDEDDDLDDYDSESEVDEALDLDVDSEPRVVLITGACGNIGRKLRAAWEDVYDLILLDANPDEDDEEVFKADLSVFDEGWITHFHGVDTVVHLAGCADPTRPIEDLIAPDLDAMANVFNAAALAGVDRIIFASSNHVMGEYQGSGDKPITVELPPRPDSPYGVLKLVGERLGQSLARAFDLVFIALRIGWVQQARNRPETIPDDWGKKLWLSNRDLIQLFDAAVEAEIEDRSFVVVNGVSRNHGTRWDLTGAAEILGYLPEDDAYATEHRAETVDEVF